MKYPKCQNNLTKIKNPHKEYNLNESRKYQQKMNARSCSLWFVPFIIPKPPKFDFSERYKCENGGCDCLGKTLSCYDPLEGKMSEPTDDSWKLTIINE